MADKKYLAFQSKKYEEGRNFNTISHNLLSLTDSKYYVGALGLHRAQLGGKFLGLWTIFCQDSFSNSSVFKHDRTHFGLCSQGRTSARHRLGGPKWQYFIDTPFLRQVNTKKWLSNTTQTFKKAQKCFFALFVFYWKYFLMICFQPTSQRISVLTAIYSRPQWTFSSHFSTTSSWVSCSL